MTRRLRLPDIAQLRLRNQQIEQPTFDNPGDVVQWFGAVQAQEYVEALWAVGLRTRGAVRADVERAIASGAIVRTWPMRGTLHFVAPNDVRWMLTYLTPRVVAATAGRHRELGLDDAVFTRAAKVCERALEGGRLLTRSALYAALGTAGIRTGESRGLHIVARLAHAGLVCFGPPSGKQPTFTLLEEWVPRAKMPSREEALAELALRYFQSHGPASVHDFAWWSGLTVGDARQAIASTKAELVSEHIDGQAYWFAPSRRKPRSDKAASNAFMLPGYDEYVVAYRDRRAVLDPALTKKVNTGGGILKPSVLVDGQVVATWSRIWRGKSATVTVSPFGRIGAVSRHDIELAAARYGAFWQLPVVTGFAQSRDRAGGSS